jgi:hypothetical protein
VYDEFSVSVHQSLNAAALIEVPAKCLQLDVIGVVCDVRMSDLSIELFSCGAES